MLSRAMFHHETLLSPFFDRRDIGLKEKTDDKAKCRVLVKDAWKQDTIDMIFPKSPLTLSENPTKLNLSPTKMSTKKSSCAPKTVCASDPSHLNTMKPQDV
jgi:hypothetical protein